MRQKISLIGRGFKKVSGRKTSGRDSEGKGTGAGDNEHTVFGVCSVESFTLDCQKTHS